jgi:transcriptional regulator with XRE-family HTH domain
MERSTDAQISDLIRQGRAHRGMTQAALASRLADLSGNLGVSRDQVARWERGGRVPSPYWRVWLGLALNLPRAQLDRAAVRTRAVRLLAASDAWEQSYSSPNTRAALATSINDRQSR